MDAQSPPITVCLDDTDMPGTRGTNKLALAMVRALAPRYRCLSVTKHPHLQHPDIPYTHRNNSCCILLERPPGLDLDALIAELEAMMLADFIEGSDPGLCVALEVPPEVQDFGRRSREEVLTMAEAEALARGAGVYLRGLGGTSQGIIGALAGAGTMAAGEPGAYLQLGARPLDLGGLISPEILLDLGIHGLLHADSGHALAPAPLRVPKKLRPSLRGGAPVIFARPAGDGILDFVRRDD
ncbi:MAG: ABC transporter substrate-binding protein [Pseudomonadota bacterium]